VPDEEKGKFQAEIGQDLIDAALKSVEKHAPSAAAEATAAPPPAPGEPVPSVDPRDREIEQLKAQLDFSAAKGRETFEKLKEEHERALRAAADLDNLRKRAVKEKEETQKFGVEKLLRDLLPVIDNLDRALEHAEQSSDVESFKKGVAMTRKLFEDAVSKYGVKSFDARGKPFDPRFHEAMQQVETDEVPANHVVMELVRGYTLHDRLMRPALVAVSKAKASNGGPDSSPAPAGAGS
jgi:molecular chaperone GrpE